MLNLQGLWVPLPWDFAGPVFDFRFQRPLMNTGI